VATPRLVEAAWEGDPEQIRALLAAGAGVNEATDAGLTPLMAATIAGNAAAARALIAAGADLDARRSPCKAMDGGWSALHDAAYAGRGEIARALVEAGATVDLPDQGGRAPLYWAASMGVVPGDREEVVEALLAGGATADSATSPEDDATLLMVALDAGNPEIATALLRAGADPNRRTARAAPIHLAQDPAVITLLAELGADLSARDGQGRTALERAKWREREDLVAALEALATRQP
jgi:ankyrin repeat protein